MEQFYKMVEASNKRFPEGVKPFQMATRLLENAARSPRKSTCGRIPASSVKSTAIPRKKILPMRSGRLW